MKLLGIVQGRNEPIRDYTDRYLSAYKRLPIKRSIQLILVAMFVKSLQRRTREEVEKHLKENYDSKKSTHFPDSLEEIYKYLTTHLSELHERLYMSLNNGNDKPSSHDNHNDDKKINRDKRKADYSSSSNGSDTKEPKKIDLKNPRGYCKEEEYSIEHLKICIAYLKSAKYKQYIKASNKKENETVPIYFNNMDSPSNSLPDVYSEIDQDLRDLFEEEIYEKFIKTTRINVTQCTTCFLWISK